MIQNIASLKNSMPNNDLNSFFDRFFGASKGISIDEQESARRLLDCLNQGGCMIEEANQIEGAIPGQSWPNIRIPIYHEPALNVGPIDMSTSEKKGKMTLKGYLEDKLSTFSALAVIRMACGQVLLNPSQTHSNVKKMEVSEKNDHSCSIIAAGRQIVKTSFDQGQISQRAPITAQAYKEPNRRGSADEEFTSINDFQNHGFFLNPPPTDESNQFTVQDLLGSHLYIYSDETMLITKNNQILAHSEGLIIQPKAMIMCGKQMYNHGGGQLSNNPCKKTEGVSLNLSDSRLLEEILPYLRGLALASIY